MIDKHIGKLIQKAREEAGLSQEQTAKLLGCSQAALSNYELGKRRLYLANIVQIAEALHKPVGYFLNEAASAPAAKARSAPDETTAEIMKLVAEMPDRERAYLLEFLKWRRDRLK